jgi:poly[(R)-3-hydroxyalkanoate] polymerase subunit PhaC
VTGASRRAATRPTRQGPRPLPLHLGNATTLWLTSRAALPFSRGGSLPWRPEFEAVARDLEACLAGVDCNALDAAVDAEIAGQADAFAQALLRYRHHPYVREMADPPVVWSEGTTGLLDYAPQGGVPVLVVPSLVNRAYILDLREDKSLLRFLARAGLRPLLVDWDKPGDVERGFSLTDYVAGRLDAAFEAAASIAGAPLAVVGYCMGGLLAVALAQRRRRETTAVALLATPWDFHAEQAARSSLLAQFATPFAAMFGNLGELPVDVLQSFFAMVDPLLALRKFLRFGMMPEGSREERDFVALEDWLNDGVPLALPTAQECLADWYGENLPGSGRWTIAGRTVEPQRIDRPALVIVPAQDRIVPPRSAAPLATLLPRATRLTPQLGHIGMIVGGDAPRAVWRPLADFLLQHGSKARWPGR